MSQIQSYNTPLFEWPHISIDDFKNVEIDYKPVKIFYNTFFEIAFFPAKIFSAFHDVFLSDLSREPGSIEEMGGKIEKELLIIFDRAYSLEQES